MYKYMQPVEKERGMTKNKKTLTTFKGCREVYIDRIPNRHRGRHRPG